MHQGQRLLATGRCEPHLLPMWDKMHAVTSTQCSTGRCVYSESPHLELQFQTASVEYAFANAGPLCFNSWSSVGCALPGDMGAIC